MKREIIIGSAILAFLALSAFLVLRSSPGNTAPASRESLDECCGKKCAIPDEDNLIWETFSRQLISVAN